MLKKMPWSVNALMNVLTNGIRRRRFLCFYYCRTIIMGIGQSNKARMGNLAYKFVTEEGKLSKGSMAVSICKLFT